MFRRAYPDDLADGEGRLPEPLLRRDPKARGRPDVYGKRDMLNALFDVFGLESGDTTVPRKNLRLDLQRPPHEQRPRSPHANSSRCSLSRPAENLHR